MCNFLICIYIYVLLCMLDNNQEDGVSYEPNGVSN